MAEIRNFVLQEKNGKETGVFTGHQPRQAALKVANRSNGTKEKPVEIRLRERGTKKVHIYKGWKELVSAPKNKPKWMPAQINKPNVKKVAVDGPNVSAPKNKPKWMPAQIDRLQVKIVAVEGPGPKR